MDVVVNERITRPGADVKGIITFRLVMMILKAVVYARKE